MAETGLYENGKKGVRRPGDPDQRINDMDRDGVDAEIIFGVLGVASRVGATKRPTRCCASTMIG